MMYRIVHIQFVDGDTWRSRARGLDNRTIEATRGNIYSDNGSLLATSLPFYRVAIDPTIADSLVFYSGIDSLSMLLERFYKEKSAVQYRKELVEARQKKRLYKILSMKYISHKDKRILETYPILREGRSGGGVIFEKINRRTHPYPNLARRTVGFISEGDTTKELIGKGLEFSFNEQLSGRDGEALYQFIAGGYWKPVHDVSKVRPENGLDVQTTIDINLQDTIHRVLDKKLRQYDADYGVAIVMEVATGEVKAIVNLGKNSKGEYTENNNYAVGNSGLAEPGSTFKLASMLAIFEETQVKLDDIVQTGSTGEYSFFDDAVMRDIVPYGKLTLQEVFEKSSNIGTSRLVHKYFRKDPMRYVEHLANWHLTSPIDFQMVGEAAPFIKKPTDASWSGSTLPWMSIGYELKISPMHILMLYNAVANNGKMLQPIIVKRVLRANKTVLEYEAKVLNAQIASPRSIDMAKQLLEGVVTQGTAKALSKADYKIAGKTGTAEKVIKGKYTEDHYTSFVGYFPADAPRYSCIVVVDDPKDKNDRYASQVAAPIFKDIADIVYNKFIYKPIPTKAEADSAMLRLPVIKAGLRDELDVLCQKFGIQTFTQTDKDWVQTKVQGDTVVWLENNIQPKLVPNVIGMRLRDAIFILENAGLKVSYKGKGRIKAQSLSPNTAFKKGSPILLRLE
ncbi:MAG: transpeptidase family protein [Bernardetiaceae bacterium]|nr:transpeptidase family protein [Bernardetiaceae bacterium]